MAGSVDADRRRAGRGVLGLFRYAFQLAPWLTTASMAVAVVAAGLAVVQPLLLGQVVGLLPTAVGGAEVGSFTALLLAFLSTVALAQVVRTPRSAFADANGAAREKDMLLRLNRVTGADPDQSSLDDPQRMSRIRQLWDRQWEAGMGMQIATGPLLEQVLATAGVAVALAFVMPWWVSAILVAAAVAQAVVFHRTVQDEFGVWAGQSEQQKQSMYAFQQATGPAAKELRIFGLGSFFRQRFWDLQTQALQPYWRRRRRRTATNLLVGSGRVVLGVGAVAYAGWLSAQGRLDLTGLATAIPLVLALTDTEVWASGQVTRGATVLRWMEELEPRVTPRSVLRVRPVLDQPVATRPTDATTRTHASAAGDRVRRGRLPLPGQRPARAGSVDLAAARSGFGRPGRGQRRREVDAGQAARRFLPPHPGCGAGRRGAAERSR